MMKTLNLKVSIETHRRLRILASHADKNGSEIITELVNRAWSETVKDLVTEPETSKE